MLKFKLWLRILRYLWRFPHALLELKLHLEGTSWLDIKLWSTHNDANTNLYRLTPAELKCPSYINLFEDVYKAGSTKCGYGHTCLGFPTALTYIPQRFSASTHITTRTIMNLHAYIGSNSRDFILSASEQSLSLFFLITLRKSAPVRSEV